jgi:predicted nucleic acid-binding protein
VDALTARRLVVDTPVVLGVLDPLDALHHPAAETVGRARDEGVEFVIPATVLAEVLVHVAKDDPGAIDIRRAQLRAAFGAPYPIDEAVAVALAMRYADGPDIPLPYGMILAVADVVGADEILTADARLARMDRRVRLVGR